jgi:hypothetical protein
MDAVKTNPDDELIPVKRAVRELTGESKSPTTLWRWAIRGLLGRDGARIRLQVQFVGRQPFTTRKLFRSWITQVTQARMARIDSRHDSNADVTEAELRAAGLLGRKKGGAK